MSMITRHLDLDEQQQHDEYFQTEWMQCRWCCARAVCECMVFAREYIQHYEPYTLMNMKDVRGISAAAGRYQRGMALVSP